MAQLLRAEFGQSDWVCCQEIRTYVEDHTPYLKKHMTAALKLEERAGHIEGNLLKSDGKKRQAFSYPDKASIRFLGLEE